MDHMCFFVLCFSCFRVCLVVTCLEMADLLAFVCDVYCIFVTLHVVSWEMWYLIVSFPDRCHLSYFVCIRIVGWHLFSCHGTPIFQLYILYSIKFGISNIFVKLPMPTYKLSRIC